jgi:hypothetical protein
MPPPRRTSLTLTPLTIAMTLSRVFSALATLGVASCVVLSARAQTPLLWGGLKPGPHAVGFRLQYKPDHSREYDPEFITDTTRFPVHRPRPILIGIWYPAQKTNASPMPYRQYLDISPGPGPLALASRLDPPCVMWSATNDGTHPER